MASLNEKLIRLLSAVLGLLMFALIGLLRECGQVVR
jgi:hypothetical protein